MPVSRSARGAYHRAARKATHAQRRGIGPQHQQVRVVDLEPRLGLLEQGLLEPFPAAGAHEPVRRRAVAPVSLRGPRHRRHVAVGPAQPVAGPASLRLLAPGVRRTDARYRRGQGRGRGPGSATGRLVGLFPQLQRDDLVFTRRVKMAMCCLGSCFAGSPAVSTTFLWTKPRLLPSMHHRGERASWSHSSLLVPPMQSVQRPYAMASSLASALGICELAVRPGWQGRGVSARIPAPRSPATERIACPVAPPILKRLVRSGKSRAGR